MNRHQLPLTTQEALDLVWPDIGNPMMTYWTDEQRLVAKRLAGAGRLFEAFGPIYEKVAQGEMNQNEAMVQLAAAAWGER